MGSDIRVTLTRQELERVLDAVVRKEMSLDDLRAWLVSVIARQGIEVGESDNDLVWQVILGLDESTEPMHEEQELGRLAERYQKVLLNVPEAAAAEALLWLAGSRDRVVQQIGSYLAGQMSNAKFAAAIEERAPAWPAELIQSVVRLSKQDLTFLREALEREDYTEARSILSL
jgi:hypothetical protein